jgi:hypothetical protein
VGNQPKLKVGWVDDLQGGHLVIQGQQVGIAAYQHRGGRCQGQIKEHLIIRVADPTR